MIATPSMVREGTVAYSVAGRYEDESSERSAVGSVRVGGDSFWRAVLTVPIPNADAVFIRIERQGALPEGYRGAEESAGFSLPVGELEAVMVVLNGIVGQARRDGVIA